MSDRTLKLDVITPDRVVVSESAVSSVTAPGVQGYFGVLANHAPLMAELSMGEIDFTRADGSSDAMAIAGGFLEVTDNRVTVLAESAELCSEIDCARAEEARTRAEERIAAHSSDIDMDRAHAALMRAINRLRVFQRHTGI